MWGGANYAGLNRIYDWSTHLSDLSFTPTLAYKTSTIAGSSFIYSIPVTSNGRGFPSVRSLMVDNKKQIALTHLADWVYILRLPTDFNFVCFFPCLFADIKFDLIWPSKKCIKLSVFLQNKAGIILYFSYRQQILWIDQNCQCFKVPQYFPTYPAHLVVLSPESIHYNWRCKSFQWINIYFHFFKKKSNLDIKTGRSYSF